MTPFLFAAWRDPEPKLSRGNNGESICVNELLFSEDPSEEVSEELNEDPNDDPDEETDEAAPRGVDEEDEDAEAGELRNVFRMRCVALRIIPAPPKNVGNLIGRRRGGRDERLERRKHRTTKQSENTKQVSFTVSLLFSPSALFSYFSC